MNDCAQVQSHGCTKKIGKGCAKGSRHPRGKRATSLGDDRKGGQAEHRASSGTKVQMSLYKQLGEFEESEGVGVGRQLGSVGDIPPNQDRQAVVQQSR